MGGGGGGGGGDGENGHIPKYQAPLQAFTCVFVTSTF